MSASDLFERIGVVLLRPKSPGNVGSVARAMKNMGFGRLIVADPISYDDPGYFDVEARRMAWRASDLLDARRTAGDLQEALAPFTFVLGTSSRPPDGARVLGPREAAAEIARRLEADASASAALLLGQEDIGLTREDLARCSLIGTIPTSDSYASLNLSQATLIFLYELRLALEGPRGATTATGAGLPTHDQLEGFYARLEETLDQVGFFQGTARPHMMRELRLIFNRSVLTGRELAIFEGMVHQIGWAARRRG